MPALPLRVVLAMNHPIEALTAALGSSLYMFWQVFWGLSFGFALSAIIEVMVSKDEIAKLLPDAGWRSVGRASLLGAVSSSCSYAAVAMARSVVRKGGDFKAAMAFQFAATNLVLELGVLLWILLGWQFAAAEFIGGGVMIVLLTVCLRMFLPKSLEDVAVEHAKGKARGAMEGHASMAMMKQEGTWTQRLSSRKGWIAVSHNYVMNWSMVWKDIAIGLLVAGALGAWVPHEFWTGFFDTGHGLTTAIWGAVIGPLIALAAFTCSIGNVPLAAVLWNGGISFGGAIAFLFGDLIIPPLLNIYRKYYGGRVTAFLFVAFYLTMVAAALVVEAVFAGTGWTPSARQAETAMGSIRLNYTTVLDGVFALVALVLTVVFARTGGPKMMREMSGDHDHADHCGHAGHGSHGA